MFRPLAPAEISRFASRKNAKPNAVTNYLCSLTGDQLADSMNLSADAASYKWNAATVGAIRDGIRLAYGG